MALVILKDRLVKNPKRKPAKKRRVKKAPNKRKAAKKRATKKRPNAKGSVRKFKKLLKGGRKKKMLRTDWQEIKRVLGKDAGPGVTKRANLARARKAKRKAR